MSKNKICYFVMGSEGSGTYMLAEALVSSGCTYSQEGNNLEAALDSRKSPVVIRRSFPHAGRLVDFVTMRDNMTDVGWSPKMICIYREPLFATKSILRRDPLRDRLMVAATMSYFYYMVARDFGDAVERVIYEKFVESADYRSLVFERLGLPEPTIEFYNANDKYKEGD